MKKVLKYGALAGVLALASCSEEEVQRVVTDADQIRYSSEVAAISRAADSYCNLDKPTDFNIWAFNEDGSLYINNDRIVSNDLGNTYINASGVRYWPVDDKGDANADLDFFAARNHGSTLTFTETVGYKNVPGFKDFTIKDGVTEQVDLIYAAAMGKNKSDETVNFNFRHALSQICFRALNHTTNLDIAIKGVKIGHLNNKGDFTFPVDAEGKPQDTHETAVTSDPADAGSESHPGNWVDGDHNDLPGNYENQQLEWQGIWANRNEDRSEALKGMTSADAYAVTPLGAAYTYGEATYTAVPRTDKTTRDYTNLTCPGKNHVNGFDQVLTLLPQTMEAWNPEQHAAEYNGAYFILDAVLENVTTDAEGNQVKTQVYKGNIAVPVDVEWYPGFRYIYTFIFDDEHQGGWTDDPSNPQPVLNPVKYDVTVDDFIPVEAGDHFIGGGDANGTNEMKINFFKGEKFADGKTPIVAFSTSEITRYYNPETGNHSDTPAEGYKPYYTYTFPAELNEWVEANTPEGFTFGGWGFWYGDEAPSTVIWGPEIPSASLYIGNTYNMAPVWIATDTKNVTVKIYFFSFDENNLISETTVQVPEDATSFNSSLIPNIEVTRNGVTQTTCGFSPNNNTTSGQDVEIGEDGIVKVQCIFRHILKVDFQGGNAPINSVINKPWPNYWGEGGLVNESNNFGFDVTIWSEAPTREGHTFLGYSTNPNGPAEEKYALNSSFSIDAAELQLYAIWEAVPQTYTGTIKLMNTAGENALYTKSETVNVGQFVNLTLDDAMVNLYAQDLPSADHNLSDLLGWTLTKGSKTVDLTKGATASCASDALREITLYPVWRGQSGNAGGSTVGSGSTGGTIGSTGQDIE